MKIHASSKWIGCFVRFGSFEIFKATDSETGRTGPSVGRNDILKQMLDYTVQTFYPEVDIRNRGIICILTLVFDSNIIVLGGVSFNQCTCIVGCMQGNAIPIQ